LRQLIGRATPRQAEIALAMTKRHMDACRKIDAPEIPMERVLQEALEIAMTEPEPDDEAIMRERHLYYMRRTYSRNYEEQ